MDDVIFVRNPRLLDVAAQLKRSVHTAFGLGYKLCEVQLITHLYIEWEISLTERAYEATHEDLQVHDGCPEHEHGIV